MSDRDGCVHLLVKGNHGCGEFRFGNGAQVVTVNHDHSVRAHEATLHTFFDAQGPVRCKAQQLVSADAASYMANVVKERCPNAVLCLDPFHIVKWATEALDEVRGEVWNQLRRDGNKEQAQYPSWVDVRPKVGNVPAADKIARVCMRAQVTRQVYTWSNPK